MKKTHLLLLKQNVNKMMTFVLEELDVIRMTIIVTTPAVVLMKRRMMMIILGGVEVYYIIITNS